MEKYISSLKGDLALLLSAMASGSKDVITFVLGNESCDLDSAVSAMVLAHFLSTRGGERRPVVVPLFNVARADVPLKTEVVSCLELCKLSAGDVPCRDEIDFRLLKEKRAIRLILVDHHERFDDLAGCIVEILDHRPLTKLPKDLNVDAEVKVKEVGSCATLVAKRIWQDDPDFDDPTALRLIRYAVVTDTVNFSEAVRKATKEDVEVVDRIDRLLGLDVASRRVDYEVVLRAKRNIENLTVSECLRKDLKVIDGGEGDNRLPAVAMASLMVSSLELLQRPNFERETLSFLEDSGCQALIILGTKITTAATDGEDGKEDLIERDIAIFPNSLSKRDEEDNLAATLVRKLPLRRELKLEIDADVSSAKTVYFKQGDPSYSRKKLMPMVREICEALATTSKRNRLFREREERQN